MRQAILEEGGEAACREDDAADEDLPLLERAPQEHPDCVKREDEMAPMLSWHGAGKKALKVILLAAGMAMVATFVTQFMSTRSLRHKIESEFDSVKNMVVRPPLQEHAPKKQHNSTTPRAINVTTTTTGHHNGTLAGDASNKSASREHAVTNAEQWRRNQSRPPAPSPSLRVKSGEVANVTTPTSASASITSVAANASGCASSPSDGASTAREPTAMANSGAVSNATAPASASSSNTSTFAANASDRASPPSDGTSAAWQSAANATIALNTTSTTTTTALTETSSTSTSKPLPAIAPCGAGEAVECPRDWFTAIVGGYYCRTYGGCSSWANRPFPRSVCPRQCSVGNTPTDSAPPPQHQQHGQHPQHQHQQHGQHPQQQHQLHGQHPQQQHQQHGQHPHQQQQQQHRPHQESVKPSMSPCSKDEGQCPVQWRTGPTGGYYCRQSGGCTAWPHGPFPRTLCHDQCTIGTIPSTGNTTTVPLPMRRVLAPGDGTRLFCWSLIQPGYERDILVRQQQLSAGIFECDDNAVVAFAQHAAEDDALPFAVVACEQVTVGVSKDGTAANALQFMKAWAAVMQDGRYSKNDWTVKVDPDAVLFPPRLREHLSSHNGQNVYVRNCDKPMTEGPMMFGSVEAISRSAMQAYSAGAGRCSHEVPWQTWGEDLFMMRCLEHLGVASVGDFDLVQDGVCKGVWCGASGAAAFHPMKSVPDWENCWRQAGLSRE